MAAVFKNVCSKGTQWNTSNLIGLRSLLKIDKLHLIIVALNRNYRVLIFICVWVCLAVCVCVYVCVCYMVTQKHNGSNHMKLEYIVVYENDSDKFNIVHSLIKVKVTV